MWNQDTYQKTILFAAKAHQGQKIPGTSISYVVHLSNVCMEILAALVNKNNDLDADICMQGALLHDVLEDTKVSEEELGNTFGEEVLRVVKSLTKDEDLPKEDRMIDSLERIGNERKEAAVIKMADRIVNLQPPPPHWHSTKIQAYRKEARLIHKYLSGAHDYLANRLNQKIKHYKQFETSE